MYQRKTKDVYILQGWYADGYEDLFEESSYKEARAQLACYNENERGIAHRIIKKAQRSEEQKVQHITDKKATYISKWNDMLSICETPAQRNICREMIEIICNNTR